MRHIILIAAMILALFPRPSLAVDTDKEFVDRSKQAVGLLYSQDESGGMRMRCTATTYQRDVKATVYVYRFLTAAHCIGSDRRDKERSASTANIPFFITFDEPNGAKKFWPARVLWVGYQSRGEDIAAFEVRSEENWPTIPLGHENTIKDGAPYWNFASPLGLGRQVMEGIVSNVNLDRPLVEGDINWSHTLVLQQAGVNGGSSGSAIVAKETRAIIGALVGTIGGSTIIAIPISRFIAIQEAVDAGKYKYYVPEVNVNPDGSTDSK